MPSTVRPRIGQPITWGGVAGHGGDRGALRSGRGTPAGEPLTEPPASGSHHPDGRGPRAGRFPQRVASVPDSDWRLWEAPLLQVRRPDLLVVPIDDLETHQPVLAVEILSPGNRGTDLVDKVEEYGRAGLPCYWVVDLEDGPSVTIYELEDDRLVERRRYRAHDTMSEEEPFPVRFRPSDLTD
ncbi:MAG: Uma2 family endonuclease [Acidimicrobiia bacterium]